jgi:hypothetical protein
MLQAMNSNIHAAALKTQDAQASIARKVNLKVL